MIPGRLYREQPSKMKLEKNRTIGGAPLIKVRDLLRYMGAGRRGSGRGMTRKEIADRVGFDIACELVREGLLAVCKDRQDREPWYEGTIAAVRLADALMNKRITRAKADLYVAELLQRADDINANPDLLYRVKRITAFGSYITDAADLGDIDIAVELEDKIPSGQSLVEANRARAAASDRKKLSWNDQLTFGEREVDRLLKGRNPYVSLIEYSSFQRLNTPAKVIYPRAE
jgi:hypothetical protein